MDSDIKGETVLSKGWFEFLKNSKSWENSLGIHLTFNYGQKSVIHKTTNLRSSPCCIMLGENYLCSDYMYTQKHPPSQFCKDLARNQVRTEHERLSVKNSKKSFLPLCMHGCYLEVL